MPPPYFCLLWICYLYQEVANIAQWEDEQIEYIKERVTEEGREEDIKKGKEPAQVFIIMANELQLQIKIIIKEISSFRFFFFLIIFPSLQVALDEAAFLLDLASVEGTWDEHVERIAGCYKDAGLHEIARFVLYRD